MPREYIHKHAGYGENKFDVSQHNDCATKITKDECSVIISIDKSDVSESNRLSEFDKLSESEQLDQLAKSLVHYKYKLEYYPNDDQLLMYPPTLEDFDQAVDIACLLILVKLTYLEHSSKCKEELFSKMKDFYLGL